jgi:hypothetical protein
VPFGRDRSEVTSARDRPEEQGKTIMTDKTTQPRVLIFDTTLRDGEQSPGATMTHDEKLEIATLLDDMGVDIIEAGFPIADWRGRISRISTAAGTQSVTRAIRAFTPSSAPRRCTGPFPIWTWTRWQSGFMTP